MIKKLKSFHKAMKGPTSEIFAKILTYKSLFGEPFGVRCSHRFFGRSKAKNTLASRSSNFFISQIGVEKRWLQGTSKASHNQLTFATTSVRQLAIFSLSLVLTLTSIDQCHSQEPLNWTIGPFKRAKEVNPIISPRNDSLFFCPVQNKIVSWESDHTFNPGAVVKDNLIFLLYRAEDDYGQGIGHHISRVGIAKSIDGLHFVRRRTPVFFPSNDDQKLNEFPGGCEDPRIVEREDGTYVMTYTQWNQKIACLAVATSTDLYSWKKHGYIFNDEEEQYYPRLYSKSGSIICRVENDRLIATKINGKYWIYWGEGQIHLASSDDLISWKPLRGADNEPVVILKSRPGKYDSGLVEAGPPAIITKDGIVLLYNGKNADQGGDPKITPAAYSAGQLLFDINDPAHLIARTEEPFFKPEESYETKGQYQGGTVFIQGLVRYHGQWFLYYGGADSFVGVTVSNSPF